MEEPHREERRADVPYSYPVPQITAVPSAKGAQRGGQDPGRPVKVEPTLVAASHSGMESPLPKNETGTALSPEEQMNEVRLLIINSEAKMIVNLKQETKDLKKEQANIVEETKE